LRSSVYQSGFEQKVAKDAKDFGGAFSLNHKELRKFKRRPFLAPSTAKDFANFLMKMAARSASFDSKRALLGRLHIDLWQLT
jgi:hypothetical protein